MIITEMQKIPETRFSERVQNQLLKKYNISNQEESRKRSIECTNLSDQNSFALLNIIDIASGMGVNIDSL
jgi:hypothetical protein